MITAIYKYYLIFLILAVVNLAAVLTFDRLKSNEPPATLLQRIVNSLQQPLSWLIVCLFPLIPLVWHTGNPMVILTFVFLPMGLPDWFVRHTHSFFAVAACYFGILVCLVYFMFHSRHWRWLVVLLLAMLTFTIKGCAVMQNAGPRPF